ncbi:MAG: tyrosine-type recombinase/integrase [Elusimicrobiota bacterium]
MSERIRMIRFERSENGRSLSLRKASQGIGISHNLLYMIEKGTMKLSNAVKEKIIRFYGLNEDFLKKDNICPSDKLKNLSNISRAPTEETLPSTTLKQMRFLKGVKNNLKLTQKKVSAELQISKSLLSAIENGSRRITPETVHLLANYYNIPQEIVKSDAFFKLIADIKNNNHLDLQLNGFKNKNCSPASSVENKTTTSGKNILLINDMAEHVFKTYADKIQRKSDYTINNYLRAAQKIREYLEKKGKPYIEATNADLDDFFETITTEIKENTDSRYVASSLHLIFFGIKAFYDVLEAKKILINYPYPISYHPPRKIKKEPEFLDLEEQRAYLQAAKDEMTSDQIRGSRNYAIAMLALNCGPRASAIRNLNIEDADFKTRLIRFSEKGSKTIEKKMGMDLFYAIKLYLQTKPGSKTSGPLFVALEKNKAGRSKETGRLKKSGLTYIINKIGKEANLKKEVHPHMLRHSYAYSIAKLTNGNLLQISNGLGHNDPASAIIYAHLAERDKNVLAEQIASNIVPNAIRPIENGDEFSNGNTNFSKPNNGNSSISNSSLLNTFIELMIEEVIRRYPQLKNIPSNREPSQ